MTVTSKLPANAERNKEIEKIQERSAQRAGSAGAQVCITKTEKAESEAQRSKPKGALGSESRNAIL